MKPFFRVVLLGCLALAISCSVPIDQKSASTSSSKTPKSRNSEAMVYVVENGKSYHTRNCRLKSGSHAVARSEAKKLGYKACKTCNPG